MTETRAFDADSQQLTNLIMDNPFHIEFNFQELVFDASDVPDKIHYKFVTESGRIDAQTNFFFKIISDKLMQADDNTQ